MKKIAALTLILALATGFAAPSAFAAGPDVPAMKKTFEATAADPVKAKAYCDMVKRMDEVGDDEKKAEAAGAEIDGYFKALGADFEAAWNAASELQEGSPDANVIDEAISKLDAVCDQKPL